MLAQPSPALLADLASALGPQRVLARAIDRLAWANDASVYRLVPQVVVLPAGVGQVQAVLRASRAHGVPLTFRAAGTSLSGQAVTDGILAVVARDWRAVEVLDGGRRVRVQPGVIGGDVNRRLQPHGTKLGPDPASIHACMLGGILANNSSGMCCGVAQNAYHTLESIRFVLPDGLELDSAEPDADAALRRGAPALAEGLLDLKRRIEGDPLLARRVRDKYRMKNTTGYSLNAFVDFERPIDILAHLLIGSEGTLGFIAEAVLRSVPDPPLKYTGLLFFSDLPRACASIAALREAGARTLELMDRASLRAIEDQAGVPAAIRELPDGAAALLVEYQAGDRDELARLRGAAAAAARTLRLAAPASFTDEPEEQAALWRVRKGLIASVGAVRRRGTSVILEDVVFPVERLAPAVGELQALLARRGYGDAIVFGHAKDGNLHFVLTQSFEDRAEVLRFDRFLRDLAELVAVRHGGALKAEHGTGRNMAPFVAVEWGERARELMGELKALVDPGGLLNPGVVVNDDPAAHVTHLKALHPADPEIDPCIECGFCERHCPSRDLTLTPRQRIVVRREMARIRDAADGSALLRELEADYAWDGLETCAADGLCATACPVAIDTGRLVKRLRGAGASPLRHELARLAAERFGLLERGARLALRAGRLAETLLGRAAVAALAAAAGRGTAAAGYLELPRAAPARRPGAGPRAAAPAAVWFPSCVSRILGAAPGDREAPVERVAAEVARRAGRPLRAIEPAHGHCCGMPFASRGYDGAARAAARATLERLWRGSERGALPVVVDSSPCALTLKQAARDGGGRFRGLRILDGIELAHDVLLPLLRPRPLRGAVAVHPVCSVRRMGLETKLVRVAAACAERADVPLAAGCCGFAGDRGFSVPQLTAAATREEAAEIRSGDHVGWYSSSRTCQIGLTRATGRVWRSYWRLVERATR